MKPKTAEWNRKYGSLQRVDWVNGLGCCVDRSHCSGPIQNHHITNGGMGRKADYDQIIPLCHRHHHLLHQIGRDAFASRYSIDLATMARRIEATWQFVEAHPW